ncbi:MAG: helix-turn-helix domain-containing protein [Pseudomonadota bacterium]|nr:helix-turn-helix domain-containing protein [Pseudomonadota bacterium]
MARPLDATARRGELLDGAFALFAARGYHALSTRDLARELGVTTGALYHWFAGKPELFVAMLERQVARQVAEALAAVAPHGPEARMAALGAHLRANMDDLQRTLLVSLDYHRAHPDGGSPLAGALAAYRDALVLQIGLPAENAGLVVSLVLGELLQRALDATHAGADLATTLPALAALASGRASDRASDYGSANAAADAPATRPPQ